MADKAKPLAAKERMELNRLRLENEQLLARFEMGEAPLSIEVWSGMGTQATRDGFAARALIAEWGNQVKALARLGFPVFINDTGSYKPKIVAELARIVFDTDGVRHIIDDNLHDTDAAWQSILERTRKIALHGTDENSVKASSVLAKFEGRVKDAVPVTAPMVNLHVLVNGATPQSEAKNVTTTHDPLAILSHEPSDVGVRIDTGDKAVDEVLQSQ